MSVRFSSPRVSKAGCAFLVMLMLSSVMASCAAGSIWDLEGVDDFLADGHVKDGITVTGDGLVLEHESGTWLQKDWTGPSGQAVWQQATGYHDMYHLDGSVAEELVLAKEKWVKYKDAPVARREHVAIWDADNGRMLVHGGMDGTAVSGDIWSYVPSTDVWTLLSDTGPARYWHSGSWVEGYDKLVVHGGMTIEGASSKSKNDTYGYDITGWHPLENATEKRYGHTSVWDPINHKVLVYGGYYGGAISKELWAYDPTADDWTRLADGPMALYEHAAVWAEGLDRMLVYGGLKEGGIAAKDLWVYDPVGNGWSQFRNGGVARSGHSMVWDMVNDELIVFGGHGGPAKFNDTWIYDPDVDDWRRGKDMPAQGRTGLTAVWDDFDKMAILYGGKDDTGDLPEVWAYSPFYNKKGWVVSSAFDVSGVSQLVNVSWFAESEPQGCQGGSVQLQLATSTSTDEGSFVFSGPGGSDTYYSNGEDIVMSLEGKRHLRYKATLSTSDTACTPVLKQVAVAYMTYLPSGNYTSVAYDTGAVAPHYISIEYEYENPGTTDVKVHFRSAGLADLSDATQWEEVSKKDTSISTPSRRYVQFKVGLLSPQPWNTPAVSLIRLLYNSVPQLVSSPVDPTTGGTDTEFTYRVLYIDADGETPVTYKVYIDGDPHDMTAEDYDYINGANFTYKTKLSTGKHTFRFEFSDGTNKTVVPAEGTFEGPVVNQPPTAALKVSKKVEVKKKVRFDASSSTDSDGSIVQYKFDFGDGTDSGWVNDSKVDHKYTKKGKFVVRVWARDDLGGEAASDTIEVKVVAAGSDDGGVPAPGTALTAVAMALASLLAALWRRRR